MRKRPTQDISADLRRMPSLLIAVEAADKLDGLIWELAEARLQRNIVAAELETCQERLAEVTAERDRESARANVNAGLFDDLVHGEVARLMAEVDRMRPVVDAAVAWGDSYRYNDATLVGDDDRLARVVDAYRSAVAQDGTARPSREAQDGPGEVGGPSAKGHGRSGSLNTSGPGEADIAIARSIAKSMGWTGDAHDRWEGGDA